MVRRWSPQVLDFGLKKGKSMKQELWSRARNSHSDNPKVAPRTKSGPADKNPKSVVGIFAIALTIIFGGVVAEAQQPKKAALICYLGSTVSGAEINMKPFRERLREIGYIEGQTITIEYRYFEGKVELLPELAAEFVRLNCDVIATQGAEAAHAVKNATKTIPVVMQFGEDAVKLGIVADLARPGGNITGMTSISAEIYGKRLELLKETVPKLARAAFLWSSTTLGAADIVKETEAVARYLRVAVQSLEVKGPDRKSTRLNSSH